MNEIYDKTINSSMRLDESNCVVFMKSVTEIFAQYSWIYSIRNVDIFLYDVLENIPTEWVQSLSPIAREELWLLPFGYIKEEWPSSLKKYVAKCIELASLRFPDVKFQDSVVNKHSCVMQKVTDKKKYEVEIMSHLVHKVCQAVKCNFVLDIGSGLGYLDKELHQHFGICSIGLDSVSKYTLAAQKRLKKDSCNRSISHQTLEIKNSEECVLALKTVLKGWKNLSCNCTLNMQVPIESQSSSFVMVGLHSCGNLAQDMMHLFCQLEDSTAFICIGCCYNKIDLKDFPMSKAAKSAVDDTRSNYPLWQPCISGLRLAAHGTRSDTDSHPTKESLKSIEREKNMFYRCLLEYFIKKENITWHQPKRHVRSSDLTDFETYCDKMFKGHILSQDPETKCKLNNLYKEKENLFDRIRILVVLQTLLQPLWETFVTVDRFMYFREKSINAEVYAMWDDSISSRNLAICAYKS